MHRGRSRSLRGRRRRRLWFGRPEQGGRLSGSHLAGLFEDHGRFTTKSDYTLVVDAEDRVVLREAIDLLKLAKDRKGLSSNELSSVSWLFRHLGGPGD